MLTLDFVSKRYGKLPSEVMSRGNTFDFHIADLAVRYENYVHEAAESKRTGRPPPAATPSRNEMMEMLKRAKETK